MLGGMPPHVAAAEAHQRVETLGGLLTQQGGMVHPVRKNGVLAVHDCDLQGDEDVVGVDLLAGQVGAGCDPPQPS